MEPDAIKEGIITAGYFVPEELEGKSQGLDAPAAHGTPGDLAKSVADDLNADAAEAVW